MGKVNMIEVRKEERVEKTLTYLNVNQSDFHKKAVTKYKSILTFKICE